MILYYYCHIVATIIVHLFTFFFNFRKKLVDKIPLFVVFYYGSHMRVLFNGRTSAFQAEYVGSIPITRSIGENPWGNALIRGENSPLIRIFNTCARSSAG